MSAIASNLQAVKARIAEAARAAGRTPESIELLAVSKTWPLACVLEAAEAGQDASETHVYFEPCEENKAVTVAESQHNEDGAGRVLDVNLVLRNVCPGRRVAVGVTLHEVDGTGGEHARGFHAMTVPAHRDGPRDVTLPRIRFVLPEDLRIEGADGPRGCRRHFVVRTSSRYVDSTVKA